MSSSITQKASVGKVGTDPLRNFKFYVIITPQGGGVSGTKANAVGSSFGTGNAAFGFMNVQGLNAQYNVIAYREGWMNTTTQKMVGQTDFSPIVLSHGVSIGGQAPDYQWVRELFSVNLDGTNGGSMEYRCTVQVNILDHPVTNGSGTTNVVGQFIIHGAWPTAISWADLDAGADALVISQLSLAHEGFSFNLPTGFGTSL